jgi:tetratricopeptide (TPR) repeat protein
LPHGAQSGLNQEGLHHAKEAVRLGPNVAKNHSILGLHYYQTFQLDFALESYQKAVNLEPLNPLNHVDLGKVWAELGESAKAFACFDKAQEIAPKEVSVQLERAKAFLVVRKLAEAETTLRAAFDTDPRNFLVAYQLSEVLIERGRLTDAVGIVDHCSSLLSPGDPAKKALQSHRKFLDMLLQLEPKLRAFRAGRYEFPKSDEALYLAEFSRWQQCYLEAAGIHRTAATQFEPPGLFASNLRYNAAFCAVLAAAGKGKDADKLSDPEKANWRNLALTWLKSDLAGWRGMINFASVKERTMTRSTLRLWQQDPYLASVRDPAALAKLPEEERERWRAFWVEVAEVIELAKKTR